MVSPVAAVAAGGALNVGANVLTDGLHDQTESIYDVLCSIDASARALLAYNKRESERTPYIIEMNATYAAGVVTLGSAGRFDPPSPINLSHVIVALVASAASDLRINATLGTRTIPLVVSSANPAVANSGVERYDLPYHIASQVTFANVAGGVPFTGAAFLWLVGWLEQNRLGPIAEIGG